MDRRQGSSQAPGSPREAAGSRFDPLADSAAALSDSAAAPSDTAPAPASRAPDPHGILSLASRDKRAAEKAVATLSLDEQVALVCETPLAQRERLLDLTPFPEEVIPRLPPAEFCFTAKAVGLWDASWILEHATAEQLVASLDLDGWEGLRPERDRLGQWLTAIAEAGEETVLRALGALDLELIVLTLRGRAHVILDHKDQDWQPPEGGRTLEGQFYLVPRKADDDLSDVLALLHALFREDYWLYFRLMQGVIWEVEGDLEEWALRWRTGRLQDLGFPAWEEAMRIYGYLPPAQRSRMPEHAFALDSAPGSLPMWMPGLPATASSPYTVFEAAAELDDEERGSFFHAFLSLANKVAVADRMPLGEADTLQQAIEATAVVVTQGLEFMAREHGLPTAEILRRVQLERLFRVGASLTGRKPPTTAESPDDPNDSFVFVPESGHGPDDSDQA